MKKFLIAILVATSALAVAAPIAQAKGGFSGGRSSFSPTRSTFRPSTPTRSTTISSPKPSTISKPAAPKVSTKPTASTKTVTAAKPKTINGKTYSSKGNVVDENYKPRFSGGYVPPAGSTVYYHGMSALDWLPFYLILNSGAAHREAVVVQPDGKEQVVKEEGKDGMYAVNWIITILFILGIIALIVWLVNRASKNKHV